MATMLPRLVKTREAVHYTCPDCGGGVVDACGRCDGYGYVERDVPGRALGVRSHKAGECHAD